MNAATAMQMSNSPVMRKRHRPMSLLVALLAQNLKEVSRQTDVMVCRQPASDVPVPASWLPSRRESREPLDAQWDEDMVDWKSVGTSTDQPEYLEHTTEPHRITVTRLGSTRPPMLLFGGVATISLIGWITLGWMALV
ncbi:MAG: hypothetical protein JF606_10590 [Burkholderiales bacterium]|jgi:hypothetical protein|nr:hypothetical protein [Burkholderiales bacterium]